MSYFLRQINKETLYKEVAIYACFFLNEEYLSQSFHYEIVEFRYHDKFLVEALT